MLVLKVDDIFCYDIPPKCTVIYISMPVYDSLNNVESFNKRIGIQCTVLSIETVSSRNKNLIL